MINTNVLGEIRTLVEELNSTAGNNDLGRKIEIGERLATYNWLLAEMVGEIYSEVNTLEYEYKVNFARKINKMQGSVNAKENVVKEEMAADAKKLTEKENLLKRLTLLHQQTNVVIEQNRQTVAALRTELKQSFNG